MSPHKFCYRISFTVQVNSTRGAELILQVFGTKNTLCAIHIKILLSIKDLLYFQTRIYLVFIHSHIHEKKMLRRTLFSLKKDYQ